jgi:hypothetical protein
MPCSERPVSVQCFVDNVPRGHSTAVAFHYRLHVVPESRLAPYGVQLVQPTRYVVVPREGVKPELHTVRFRKVQHAVTGAKVEYAGLALDCLPFAFVHRDERVEIQGRC